MDITKTSGEIKSSNIDDNKVIDSFNINDRKSLETIDASPDKLNKIDSAETRKSDIKPYEDGFYTTKKERLDHCPIVDGPRGEWSGERGESLFIPKIYFIKELLKSYGIEGIKYINGVPDFSPVALATVEIDNMTEDRYGTGKNFEQFDAKLAEQFNKESKDGKTDWDARAVADYISENNLIRHERSDCKTMDLIDFKIHAYFTHLGGCSECKHRDGNAGGEFDA